MEEYKNLTAIEVMANEALLRIRGYNKKEIEEILKEIDEKWSFQCNYIDLVNNQIKSRENPELLEAKK